MKINALSQVQMLTPTLKKEKVKSVDMGTVSRMQNYSVFTFRGNPAKRPDQIAAYATESNFLGGIYKAGGLGDVGEALPEAIGVHGEKVTGKAIDARTFFPYYSYNNAEGRLYVAKKGIEDKVANKVDLKISEDFMLVDSNYQLKEGEKFTLITEGKDGKATKYFFLEDLGLNGEVNRVARDGLEMEQVPYRVFEINTNGTRKDGMYLIHTQEVAGGKSAYGINTKYNKASGGSTAYGGTTPPKLVSTSGSSAYGGQKAPSQGFVKHFNGNAANDLFYTEQIRAMERSLEAMNSNKFNHFNPQNIILHDRFPAVMLTDAMEYAQQGNSYWNGIRYVDIFHNPGRGYQGVFGNPLDFFRIIANDADITRLKASPNYDKVKAIAEKIGQGTATQQECEAVYKFFEPYFKQFVDSEGCFNMTKIALAAAESNPDLVSTGHVSKYFGKEAANFATEDIAKGLTGDFQRLDEYVLSVTNGAKPANMATGAQDAFFGTGTLNDIFKDVKNTRKYTPFLKTDGPDKIFKAKAANKKNLIEILADATVKSNTDPDAIAKVFFSGSKIDAIRNGQADLKLTLGGFSNFTKDDLLFVSWGRPDPQKGLKTAARSFRMFLEDESIPLETRKRCKFLFGAGGGNDAWRPVNGVEPSEWTGIQEELKKIAEIESGGTKGVFKGNALYVNGLFPNRIANCADLAVLTSRYEPCGITPFESFATGTPVLSIKTGGAPDFVTEGKTGFLTQDAFMLSHEKLGISKDITAEALDEARVENSAKQVRDKMKEYLEPLKNGTFEKKQKEFIENCFNEKIEWHNNNAYNGGKSALEIYLKDKCRTQDHNVNGIFKSNGRGLFDESAFNNLKESGWWQRLSKTNKVMAVLGLATIAAGTAYGIYKSQKGSSVDIMVKPKSQEKETKHLSAVV